MTLYHERASADIGDLDYVLVPLDRCELELIVDLWASSDTRSAADLSLQLKARGAIAELADVDAAITAAQRARRKAERA